MCQKQHRAETNGTYKWIHMFKWLFLNSKNSEGPHQQCVPGFGDEQFQGVGLWNFLQHLRSLLRRSKAAWSVSFFRTRLLKFFSGWFYRCRFLLSDFDWIETQILTFEEKLLTLGSHAARCQIMELNDGQHQSFWSCWRKDMGHKLRTTKLKRVGYERLTPYSTIGLSLFCGYNIKKTQACSLVTRILWYPRQPSNWTTHHICLKFSYKILVVNLHIPIWNIWVR